MTAKPHFSGAAPLSCPKGNSLQGRFLLFKVSPPALTFHDSTYSRIIWGYNLGFLSAVVVLSVILSRQPGLWGLLTVWILQSRQQKRFKSMPLLLLVGGETQELKKCSEEMCYKAKGRWEDPPPAVGSHASLSGKIWRDRWLRCTQGCSVPGTKAPCLFKSPCPQRWHRCSRSLTETCNWNTGVPEWPVRLGTGRVFQRRL